MVVFVFIMIAGRDYIAQMEETTVIIVVVGGFSVLVFYSYFTDRRSKPKDYLGGDISAGEFFWDVWDVVRMLSIFISAVVAAVGYFGLIKWALAVKIIAGGVFVWILYKIIASIFFDKGGSKSCGCKGSVTCDVCGKKRPDYYETKSKSPRGMR